MVHLYDVIDNKLVGEYNSAEDAVKHVGVVMTLFGSDMARTRFVVTDPPKNRKSKTVKTIYTAQETWQRALVYFSPKFFERRKLYKQGLI